MTPKQRRAIAIKKKKIEEQLAQAVYRPLTVTTINPRNGETFKPISKAAQKRTVEAFRRSKNSNHSSLARTLQPILDDCFQNNQSFILHFHAPTGRFYIQGMKDDDIPGVISAKEWEKRAKRAAKGRLKAASGKFYKRTIENDPRKATIEDFLDWLNDYLELSREGYTWVGPTPMYVATWLEPRGMANEKHIGVAEVEFFKNPQMRIELAVPQIGYFLSKGEVVPAKLLLDFQIGLLDMRERGLKWQ